MFSSFVKLTIICMDYCEMSVACVLVLFAHMESLEIRSTLCILENQKEFSSEMKNT